MKNRIYIVFKNISLLLLGLLLYPAFLAARESKVEILAPKSHSHYYPMIKIKY